MRSYRIRLSDWLHHKAHGVRHTHWILRESIFAIAFSPYGKALSGKSEGIRCLVDQEANHRFSFPSKARQKQGAFPPSALPDLTGTIPLSDFHPGQKLTFLLRATTPHPIADLPRYPSYLPDMLPSLPRQIRIGACNGFLPGLRRPSSNIGRVGIYNFPFGACSRFTCVAACQVAAALWLTSFPKASAGILLYPTVWVATGMNR
jgi:hypothetical protein